MQLYSNPMSRGRVVEWYIRELGISDKVEVIKLDMQAKEHKAQDYVNKIQPFGRLPALVDGDVVLFESGAILMYLAETYGGLDTKQKRAEAGKWVWFAFTTLSDSAVIPACRDKGWMEEVLTTLDKILCERDYIQGPKFGVGDVAVGSYLEWLPAVVPDFKLEPYTHVKSYVDRLKARPAFAGDGTKPQE